MAKNNTQTSEEAKLSLKQSAALSWRLVRMGWKVRPSMVLGYFVGAAMEIAASVVSIYATAKLGGLLASFIATGKTSHIWFWLFTDIAAAAIIAMGFLVMRFSNRLMYFNLVRWCTNEFMKTINTIDLGDFYDEKQRNLLNKVNNTYTWQIPNLYDANLDLVYGIARFLVITMVVSQITWWIVPVIALFLIPSLIAERRIAQISWFVWDQKGDQRHVFWGLDWIIRQPKGQMEIRGSQAGDYLVRKIDSMNHEFYTEQEKLLKQSTRMQVGTRLLESAGTAVGAIVVLRQLLARSISLERYFFLSGALLRVGSALNAVFGTMSRMQEPLLYANNFFNLIDSRPSIIDPPDAPELTAKKAPLIEFKDVSFTYPGQSVPVFEHLDLKINPGEHVALVGENGAGKSTLIKLLLRFYRPDTGAILINGVDLQSLAIDSWYEQIATLFQDFNHYPFSVEGNIYIGRPNAKPNAKQRDAAAQSSNVDSIVTKYKHGWDTVLDSSFKKGIEPSGGQWQRVALARAFYRQAQLLILDEPTSAIDAKAEYDIFNNIFEHYQNRSAIIVSHRFSTVRRADRIMVLEAGAIIEEGTHESLMKKKKMYYTLFSNQAEGYR